MNQPFAKRDSSPAALAFDAIDRHYVLASFRCVGIAVWVDEASLETIEQARAMLERLAAAWPEGIAYLQVIGEDCRRLDTPAREALKELLLAGRGSIREAPVVYEGSGFRAAELRAIVTGLLPLRTLGFPHRVYSTIDEAALALARMLEKREPTRYARELCEALATLRDRHQRAFPSAPKSFIRYRG